MSSSLILWSWKIWRIEERSGAQRVRLFSCWRKADSLVRRRARAMQMALFSRNVPAEVETTRSGRISFWMTMLNIPGGKLWATGHKIFLSIFGPKK